MLIILLAYSQITLHQKIDSLTSQLSSIQSEVSSTRGYISNELYQLNQSEQMYHFEGFNVLDKTLSLDHETLKISFELTFTKMPVNGDLKLEISSTDERLITYSPYGFEQPYDSDSLYHLKETITLEGSNNRYTGEILLDLNKNYAFAILVDDGKEQSKESIGVIAAQEWFKSPSNISVIMNGLSITAPSGGQFSFDLYVGNHASDDPYQYDYYNKSLFDFNTLERIASDDIKSITYKIYYKESLLDTVEVTDLKWENNAIKITDSVAFVADINKSDQHTFRFEVTLITITGETFESEYIGIY